MNPLRLMSAAVTRSVMNLGAFIQTREAIRARHPSRWPQEEIDKQRAHLAALADADLLLRRLVLFSDEPAVNRLIARLTEEDRECSN